MAEKLGDILKDVLKDIGCPERCQNAKIIGFYSLPRNRKEFERLFENTLVVIDFSDLYSPRAEELGRFIYLRGLCERSRRKLGAFRINSETRSFMDKNGFSKYFDFV